MAAEWDTVREADEARLRCRVAGPAVASPVASAVRTIFFPGGLSRLWAGCCRRPVGDARRGGRASPCCRHSMAVWWAMVAFGCRCSEEWSWLLGGVGGLGAGAGLA